MMKTPLLGEVKKQPRRLARLSGLIFLTALAIAGFTAVFAKLLDRLILGNMEMDKAAPFLGALLCLALLRCLLDFLRQQTALDLSLHIQEDLRQRLSRRLLAQDVLSHQDMTGDFIALAVSSIDETDSFFSQFLPQLLAALIYPPVFLAAALAADPWTALIFFLTAPLLPFLLYLIGRMAASASAKQWQVLATLSHSFFELLQGLTTLKIFNRSREQIEQVNTISHSFSQNTLRVLRIAFLSAFVLELVSTLSIALVAVSSGLRLLNDSLAFTAAFFVLLLAPEFYRPLRQCGAAFHQALTAVTAARGVYAYIAEEPPAPPCRSSFIKRTTSPFTIRFENVSYTYDQRAAQALSNLSLTIKAGSKAALIGNSGAGKSTILRLLLRFAEPAQGRILVNDLDLGRIDPAFWRSRISYVPQDPYIFQGTIAENIDLAATASPDAILQAAKSARIHDFVSTLPDGYETRIDPRSLSGGQIQRLALARAFLEDRPLLLLDEPTAHLDAATEASLAKSLEELAFGKTTILVSHKTSLVRDAALFVIEDGQLAESGTSAELWQQRGIYFTLASLQGGRI